MDTNHLPSFDPNWSSPFPARLLPIPPTEEELLVYARNGKPSNIKRLARGTAFHLTRICKIARPILAILFAAYAGPLIAPNTFRHILISKKAICCLFAVYAVCEAVKKLFPVLLQYSKPHLNCYFMGQLKKEFNNGKIANPDVAKELIDHIEDPTKADSAWIAPALIAYNTRQIQKIDQMIQEGDLDSATQLALRMTKKVDGPHRDSRQQQLARVNGLYADDVYLCEKAQACIQQGAFLLAKKLILQVTESADRNDLLLKMTVEYLKKYEQDPNQILNTVNYIDLYELLDYVALVDTFLAKVELATDRFYGIQTDTQPKLLEEFVTQFCCHVKPDISLALDAVMLLHDSSKRTALLKDLAGKIQTQTARPLPLPGLKESAERVAWFLNNHTSPEFEQVRQHEIFFKLIATQEQLLPDFQSITLAKHMQEGADPLQIAREAQELIELFNEDDEYSDIPDYPYSHPDEVLYYCNYLTQRPKKGALPAFDRSSPAMRIYGYLKS